MSTNDSVEGELAGLPDKVKKALRLIKNPDEYRRRVAEMHDMHGTTPASLRPSASSAGSVVVQNPRAQGLGKRLPGELARLANASRPSVSDADEEEPGQSRKRAREEVEVPKKAQKVVAKAVKAPKTAPKESKAPSSSAKSPVSGKRVAGKSIKAIKGIKATKAAKTVSNKAKSALEGIDKTKKKHRWRPGTVALRDIKKLQKSTDCQFAFGPFTRLVREIAQEYASPKVISEGGMRFTEKAMQALQQAAEEHVTNTFRKAYEISLARGQVSLMAEDMQTLKAIEKIGV